MTMAPAIAAPTPSFNTSPAPPSQSSQQANLRSSKDYARARRHSWLVATLRKILPMSAIALVILFAGHVSFSLSALPKISIDSTAIKDGKLVMNAPKMTGFDSKKRAYNVKAVNAIQELDKPNIVFLQNLVARLPMDEKSIAKVTAKTGIYNAKKETLILKENVKISGVRDMLIELRDANIDMKTGSMKSDHPVKVSSKDATITADSVIVTNNGERIIFRRRVSMTIQPKSIKRGSEIQSASKEQSK